MNRGFQERLDELDVKLFDTEAIRHGYWGSTTDRNKTKNVCFCRHKPAFA